MPGSAGNAIRAGRAFIELFADDRKLVRGLRKAQARLKAFGAGVRAMGTKLLTAGSAIAAPLLIATKIFTSAGDEIHKMSIRTGVSAEALSQLKFAAEQSGASLATVEKGIRGMQRGLVDAERGLSTATDNLNDLGLSLDQIQGKTPEEQFLIFADAISRIEDPSRQAALAMKVFGKAGADLIPLMKGGRASIQDLMKEADRLGLTITGPMAKSAAESADAWNRVKQTLRGVAIQVGGALAPTITKLGNTVAKITTTVINWVKANGPLIRTIFKIAAGAIAAGAALVAAGVLISSFGAILGGIASTIGLVGSAFGLLLSPIGLVVVAIGIALAIAWTFSAGFRKAIGGAAEFVGQLFRNLAKTIGESFAGIKDALAVGDFASAWKIATIGVQVAFFEMVESLDVAWGGFITAAVEGVKNFVGQAIEVFQKLGGIIDSIIDKVSELSKTNIFGEVIEERPAGPSAAERRLDTVTQIGGGLQNKARQKSKQEIFDRLKGVDTAALEKRLIAQGKADVESGRFGFSTKRADQKRTGLDLPPLTPLSEIDDLQKGFADLGVASERLKELRDLQADIQGNLNEIADVKRLVAAERKSGVAFGLGEVNAVALGKRTVDDVIGKQAKQVEEEAAKPKSIVSGLLDDLRRKLDQRLADAGDKRAAAIEAAKAIVAPVNPDPKLDQLIAKVIAVAGPVAQAAIAKVSGSDVSGTFSAEGGRSLGPSTVQEKQLDEQKLGNVKLEAIKKELEKADELVFGA